MIEGFFPLKGSFIVSTLNIASVSALPPSSCGKSSDVALLTVFHLFWHCTTSSPSGHLPIVFHVLFDHGSHVVLISDEFA
jgi:hypothetical protein